MTVTRRTSSEIRTSEIFIQFREFLSVERGWYRDIARDSSSGTANEPLEQIEIARNRRSALVLLWKTAEIRNRLTGIKTPNRYSMPIGSFFLPRVRGRRRDSNTPAGWDLFQRDRRSRYRGGSSKSCDKTWPQFGTVCAALASTVMKIETFLGPRGPPGTSREQAAGSSSTPNTRTRASEQGGMQRTRDQEDSINIWGSEQQTTDGRRERERERERDR